MSTFHQISDGEAYPAVLLTHGINDPRVAPWQSAKTAARFQQATGSGKPVLLTRVVRVDSAIFGAVRAEHTVIDGSPVRDPATWVPLHTLYWNNHLQPFGLEVSPDMPFWIEEFELVYDGGN